MAKDIAQFMQDVLGIAVDARQASAISEWLRQNREEAVDEGIRIAGRYGHEDGWDDEIDPFAENPYRRSE